MKKSNIIIIIVLIVIIGIGAIILLTGSKECAELNEEECKKANNCLSVLMPVPCDDEGCSIEAEFKECKDKTE